MWCIKPELEDNLSLLQESLDEIYNHQIPNWAFFRNRLYKFDYDGNTYTDDIEFSR
jgi:hypothetical protein